ncbi:hypothetical protein [Deinococcus arcticus]|uniref:IrrE N-terminal-like domain-containing protein n=1 Tax=Deinococcus arcticus TaxID=2136176 RepID=A0A2T3W641_9DEIO|nr:hypothetical protein [Deinococcus arcticus]PTA67332.1 hypothetical protein C8263_13625 [Deinococcus arcticus]
MARPDAAAHFDELVRRTQIYRNSAEYLEALRVVAALSGFSPFNAYLLQVQRPTLRFAARLPDWEWKFRRTVRSDRPVFPLVILKPFGPVDFVIDYEDTQGEPLPQQVLEPYRAHGYVSSESWECLMRNARRRGVLVEFRDDGSGAAGSIGPYSLPVGTGWKPQKLNKEEPPVRYRVQLSGQTTQLNRASQFVTLLHELGHLCCGHVGGISSDDWPQRPHEVPQVAEFEAESVAFIVCRRLGLDSNSEEYLAGYVGRGEDVPHGVSIYTILKAAGLIEGWATKLSWPQKPRKEASERRRRGLDQ